MGAEDGQSTGENMKRSRRRRRGMTRVGKKRKKRLRVTKAGKLMGLLVVVILFLFMVIVGSKYFGNSAYITTSLAKVTGDIYNVSPKINGEISSIYIKAGDLVSQGEVLFTLDTEQIKNQVDEAYAAQEIAFANLEKVMYVKQGGQAVTGTLNNQGSVNNSGLSGRDILVQNIKSEELEFDNLVQELVDYKLPDLHIFNSSYAIDKLKKERKDRVITLTEYNEKMKKVSNIRILKTKLVHNNAALKELDNNPKNNSVISKIDNNKSTGANNKVSSKDYEILQNTVKAAQAKYNLAKLSLSYASVLSPANGTIVQLGANIGDAVSPEHYVVTLVDLSKLTITAYVKQSEVKKIKAGQKVIISIDALSPNKFDGKVKSVGVATADLYSLVQSETVIKNNSKNTQNVPIVIEFKYYGKQVILGMDANVKIKVN